MTTDILDTPIRTKRAYTRRAPEYAPNDETPRSSPVDATAALEARIAALEATLADLAEMSIKAREPSATNQWAHKRRLAERKAAREAVRDLP